VQQPKNLNNGDSYTTNNLSFVLAADQARHLQDQMSGAAMAMPPDPKAAFKAEWEALEICEHHWALANIENEILGLAGPPADSIYHQNKVD
jgi:hypothetical protein